MQAQDTGIEYVYIIGSLGMFVLALGIVVFAVIYNTKRKGFELKQSTLKLAQEKALVDSEISSSEKERDRIAKQLHDDINNRLTFLKMQMNLIKDQELKSNLSKEIDNTITEIRELSHSISAQNVERFGLLAGLKSIQQKINGADEMEVSIEAADEWNGRKDPSDLMVYRVCQEWIGNSIKHGKAKKVHLVLRSSDFESTLEYNDDGVGMNIDEIKKNNLGHGMNNILARVERINGSLKQESSPNEGVKFELTWKK